MIQISQNSGIYQLKALQQLPIKLEQAWEFFSSPANLQKITPPHMGFLITSNTGSSTYAGQIITYKVAPFAGIKTNWVTEITSVEFQKRFVDEQRFGPYSMWHHEHLFESNEHGVLMTDIVSYKVPFGPMGHLVHPFLVKPQLMKIFNYREKVLEELFPNK